MSNEYYIVKADALPEVMVNVAEAKRLLENREVNSVAEAIERMKISRSSYYKYKDSIDSISEMQRVRAITIACKCKNQPGILSQILDVIFKAQMNVETIFQSVPVGGIAEISIHAKYMTAGISIGELLDRIQNISGVATVRLLAQEEE